MAVTATGITVVRVQATRTETLDLATDTSNIDDENSVTYTSGTGTNCINEIWSDSCSAAASADDHDLSNLTQGERSGIAFAKVRTLRIFNSSTTTSYDLLVGAAASNPVAWFADTTDKIRIEPGGELLLTSPIDGMAVASDSADILRVDPGANTVTYDIEITGVAAT